MRAWGLLLSFSLLAVTGASSLHAAGSPPGRDAGATPPAAALDAGTQAQSEPCRLDIAFLSLDINVLCHIDSHVKEYGQLQAPCREGDARAVFGEGERAQRFTGRVAQGQLNLRSRTEYDFDDGCHWETEQTLTGAVDSGQLRFTYRERPVRGQHCGKPCSAQGKLVTTFTRKCACGGADVTPHPDDDDSPTLTRR